MSFDVEMPDGTIIEDVPDGTTQQQITARYQKHSAAAGPPPSPDKVGLSETSARNANEQYNAADDNSFLDNAAIGLARSGHHILERGSNLGLKVFKTLGSQGAKDVLEGTGFGSNADIASRETTDKDLLNTVGGTIGNLVGDVAFTAPVGEVGGAMKAAGLAARGGSRLARTLQAMGRSAAVRGATEGAIQGAATGDSSGGTGAGAAAGGVLGAAGTVGGKLLRGVVEKSGAANALEAEAAKSGKRIFLPLSLASSNENIASDLVGGGYRHGLNLVPGASGQLERQSGRAMQTIRDIAAEKAAPAGFKASGFATEMDRKLATEDAFDKAYAGTIKKYMFDRPPDFRSRVIQNIENNMPGVDDVTKNKVATLIDQHMERFSSNKGTISGQNLLNTRNMSNSEYRGLAGPEKEALRHGVGAIDDIVDDAIKSTTDPQKLKDLTAYQDLATPWSNFKAYAGAVEKAKVNGGSFTAAQLARSAHPVRQEDIYNLATAAHEVMKGSESQHGRVLSSALRYGLGVSTALHSPHLAAGIIGAGNVLATKTAQKVLTGDLATQKTLAEMLKKRYAGDVTGAFRRAAVSGIVD